MPDNNDFYIQNRNMYDGWAQTYDDYSNSTVFCDEKNFPKHWVMMPPSNVLEIGCGTGRHTQKLSRLRHKITAIDISSSMLEVAKAKAINAKFIHGNFLEYDFAGFRFDFIIMALVLEHLPDKAIVFSKIANLLPKGGKFFLSEIHHSRMENGSGARFIDDEGKEIRAASFIHTSEDIIKTSREHGFELAGNEVIYGTSELARQNRDWDKYISRPMIEIYEFIRI